MEKRISYSQFQSVKSVAKACNPLMVQRDKALAKIMKLKEEYEAYDTQIKTLEAGIQQILGFRVEQLVKKVVETDAKGNKTTKYLPTDIVSYDDTHKEYVIKAKDEEPIEVPENEGAGSDFDIDKENQTPWNN